MTSKHSPYGNGSRAKKCRECGRHEDVAGRMSARALCSDCGARRNVDNSDQIAAGTGPYYEEWRKGLIAFARDLEATRTSRYA